MTLYNVGDKVVIRDDLDFGRDYGNLTFEPEMEHLAGDILTVASVDEDGDYIMEESPEWYFNDEMIVGSVEQLMFIEDLDFDDISCNLGQLELDAEPQESKVPFEVVKLNDVSTVRLPVQKVIHNDPATILFYYGSNGQIKKSVAKVNKAEGDVYNKDRGIEVATIKAMMKELQKQLNKY